LVFLSQFSIAKKKDTSKIGLHPIPSGKRFIVYSNFPEGMIHMYHYLVIHHYHPWYGPIAVPFIPPPPVPPAAVTYRNFWLNPF